MYRFFGERETFENSFSPKSSCLTSSEHDDVHVTCSLIFTSTPTHTSYISEPFSLTHVMHVFSTFDTRPPDQTQDSSPTGTNSLLPLLKWLCRLDLSFPEVRGWMEEKATDSWWGNNQGSLVFDLSTQHSNRREEKAKNQSRRKTRRGGGSTPKIGCLLTTQSLPVSVRITKRKDTYLFGFDLKPIIVWSVILSLSLSPLIAQFLVSTKNDRRLTFMHWLNYSDARKWAIAANRSWFSFLSPPFVRLYPFPPLLFPSLCAFKIFSIGLNEQKQ